MTATLMPPRDRVFLASTVSACAAGAAGTLLFGVSGWFIVASAAAGAAGPAAALAFNYLLPSAAIRLLAIVRTAARYGERVLSHQVALRHMASLRARLFTGMATRQASCGITIDAGEAATTMIEDVHCIENASVRRATDGGVAGAVAACVGLLAFTEWRAAAPLLVGVVAMALFARALGHALERGSARVREATVAFKDSLATLTLCGPELRCYGIESIARDALDAQAERLRSAKLARIRALSGYDIVTASVSACATALSVLMSAEAGAAVAALAGLCTLGALQVAGEWFKHSASDRADTLQAATRLEAILDSADEPARKQRAGERSTHDAAPPTIDFARHGLELAPGDRLAVVGPSGCGKTTLVETLLGLRPATAGEVLVGGHDLARAPRGSRGLFAWLPQDVVLLSGTVRDNLLLARPQASVEELWAALDDAALADVVRAMPRGLDQWIGEDACGLSGGERRRLGLARAYLCAAPWLLLDEPTEGLDATTERRVIEALVRRAAHTGQGIVAVTHRPAVIAAMSRTMVVAPPLSAPSAGDAPEPVIDPELAA